MEIKTIKKSISIHAPKENVWKVLITDEYNRKWYATFSEGTYADTSWEVGSKVIFQDNSNSGIVGKITANQLYDLLSIEYEGVINNGIEDYESEMAKGLKGTQEIYRLKQEGSTTILDISCDMGEGYFDMMSAAWDRALVLIKDMSESL